MMRPIGYYVHHQGDGHLQRALSIAAHSAGRVVILGTGIAGRTGNVEYVNLPDDHTDPDYNGTDGARTRPFALHYAPLDHDGVRHRMSLIAQWIGAERPALFVVDVSVEIAMLARLCSTPVVYVRLSGRREDKAHLEAFRLAEALLAPFDARLDDLEIPEWVRSKTLFCPGIVSSSVQANSQKVGTILIVKGTGGSAADGNALANAARFVPGRKWRVIGPCTVPQDCPDNLEIAGWAGDPVAEISTAEVVVGAAGDGLVSHVLAAGRPFICIPEDRPYDEQRHKAAALKRFRVAVVLDEWPVVEEWPIALALAKTLDLQMAKDLGDPGGSIKAYRAIQRIIDR